MLMVGKKIIQSTVCIFFAVALSVLAPLSTYALTEAQLDMFAQNNILFYDPGAGGCVSAAAGMIGDSDGSDVYMIGDSITVLSQNEIKSEMPNITLNAKSGIYFSHDDETFGESGVSRIASMGEQSILVFALGTNGGINQMYRDDTEKFFAATQGKDIKVIFMTTFNKDHPSSQQVSNSNAIVKDLALQYDNISYMDWYAIASSNPEEYIDDNVHPTAVGKVKFAKLLKEAVDRVSIMNIPTNYGSGDDARVLSAKNANQDVFNVDSSSEWYAGWSDSNTESMARVLNHYGDLAYQLGDVAGIPWVAVIVQMRYEDPFSRCGHNNFWGNGCTGDHTGTGEATAQGANLGEGFLKYRNTLHNSMFTPYNEQVHFLGESDPKAYLEKIGPMWVQGDPNGAGYGSIDGMKKSVDALMTFIESSEGQAIVKTFGNYHGTYSTYSASSICAGSSSVVGPVFYSQYDPLWKDIPYDRNGCGTIGTAGCGPASLASIIATLTGNASVTPDVIAEKAIEKGYRGCQTDCNCHGSSHAITELAQDYGLKVEDFGRPSIEEISNYLRQGWMFHVAGSGDTPFSAGGHFIGIRGITADGKWLIFDSGNSSNNDKEWNPSDIYSKVHSDWRGVSR